MVVERIAGQDHDIGAEIPRHIEDAAQPGRAVAAMHRRDAVVIDMQVGGMDEEDVPLSALGIIWHVRSSLAFVTVIPAKPGSTDKPLWSAATGGSRLPPG